MGTPTWMPGYGSDNGATAPDGGRSAAPGDGGRGRAPVTRRPGAAGSHGLRQAGRPDGGARHSIPLGRVAGVRLQVHWTFLALLALVVVAEWPGGARAVAAGLAWIVVLFACVVAHEVAHCVVARRRGGSVLGILLLPIGGMSRMDRMPSAPADEAAVAVAGPATSLAIGGLSLAIGAAIGSSMWPPTMFAGSWWARVGWLNVLLAAFNLLPALPMDGGRVLRATLARRRTRWQATRIACTVARVLAVALVVVGVLWDFWLVLIGAFVLFGAAGEEAQAEVEERRHHGPRGGSRWGDPPWAGGPRNGDPWSSGSPTWGPPGWGPPPGPGHPRWGPPGSSPPGWGPPPSDRPPSDPPPSDRPPGGDPGGTDLGDGSWPSRTDGRRTSQEWTYIPPATQRR